MSEEAKTREDITRFAKSIFERGLTNGSSGNISVRLSHGDILITPTGSSMGFLDPARISLISSDGAHLAGDKPTKEIPLHTAFYDTRPSAGAVVHLHCTYATALSMLPDIDRENVLPTLTPYAIMRLGKVKWLPFFVPGDPAMGAAVRAIAGRHSAVLLANHGPVVAGDALAGTVYAMEELEENAKLAILTRGLNPVGMTVSEVAQVVQQFNVDYG
ncbi:aldolase [Cognatiyoonia sp. IB215446]|uniref:3-oxo-tetronate 4-phosphate decarboxylase n=1 Tax=Cognatiyoonia sp. IB215446 TaxID=3097355 RepID=UPI002A15276B|nr:aldolase [Cognatiyoonia sp. IB215446]MDX8350590.1 aldolase [Cognatiyoonia sp. IB215446]